MQTYSDVLRKHMKTCSARISQGFQMPITGCPGKKVHACDQCAGTKKACSSGWPCSGCTAKGRSCTYERLRIRESISPDSSNLGFEIIDNTEDAFLEPADQFMTLEFAEWALSTPDLFPGSDGNPDGSGRCGVIDRKSVV